MICVSINNPTPKRCAKLLESQHLQMAEILLDSAELSPEEIRAIFSLPIPLIATCRPTANRSETQRVEILLTAIDAGAAYVDIEMEATVENRFSIFDAARAKGCKVICSYHNFECTPKKFDLNEILFICLGASDIAKIACLAHNIDDCIRLLSLYSCDFKCFRTKTDFPKHIMVIAMGEIGKITRVAAPFLGAPFTYASIEEGQETAPGQLPQKAMETIYQLLK